MPSFKIFWLAMQLQDKFPTAISTACDTHASALGFHT